MADDSHASPPLPTAVLLHEPEFPYPDDSATSEKMHIADFAPNGASRIPATLSRTASDPSSTPRPSMQKSATERPRPPVRRSLLGRKRAGTADRAPRLNRQVTLTFDPFSSDSSSSDSDSDSEPTSPARVDGESGNAPKANKERRRQKSSGTPFSRFKMKNEHFDTKGKVSKHDGRLKLSINETMNSGYFAKTLGAGLKKHFKSPDDDESVESTVDADIDRAKIAPEDDCMEDPARRIRLNIVVIVIGSRGDIQPFLRIGKILKEDYGHRVRIATHPAFKQFVEQDSGLEFFSIGGDPSELMAFMVKNPGLIPNLETVKEGEIGRRRAAMSEMFDGMWRACVNSTDDEKDQANIKLLGNKFPFVCDAIIANPPSFAPPHIAERLGIPLHMMFTFPYSPTTQFPHPLANIKATNVDAKYVNFMSYPLVEMMTWQGLGDLINRFRAKTLCLEEVSTLWAPGQLYRLRVPYTYMWSPGLVPKPKDWGAEIDISGFVFLDLASSFRPPDDLVKFLDAGPPPVYIGFGSIVVDDPDGFTKLIYEAVEIAGVRALVSKGWGGFGSNDNAPDNVFMLENTPHDWLFPKVSAVVHHGGAGTTAAGLKCGKPTMIVPFFGDQPFWGAMVSKARAGAHECIPYKKLTAERLAEGIKQCLTDEAKKNVQEIADSIAKEGDGALNAVRSFHRSLPLRETDSMRCSLLPTYAAAWRLKDTSLRLSPVAAELLVEWKKVKWSDLRLIRHYEWNDFGGPGEPVTGAWSAIAGTVSDVAAGVGMVPVKMVKSVKKREKYYSKKHRIEKREKHKKKTLEKVNQGIPNATAITKSNSNKEEKQQNGRPQAPSRQESTLSQLSEPDEYLAEELAHEAGHGFKKTGAAILKSPMNFTLAITQGFHNAPRLYGDETVRRPPRITGFHSGLRAGRDEFIYGIRDGITGLWMQPYRGAKKRGALGFVQGIGFGVGGFVLKDIAAFLGPGAYFMKGLDEEHLKKYQPTDFLRRARIMQGRKEVDELIHSSIGSDKLEDVETSLQRKRDIEDRVSASWKKVQTRIKEERRKSRTGVRAALLGHSKYSEGKRVPLKSERPGTASTVDNDRQTQPKHAKSVPIEQAEKIEEGNANGAVTANGKGLGPPRTGTAPPKATQWKERGSKKKFRLDSVPAPPENQAVKEEAVARKEIPNVFQASLQGNGYPVGKHQAEEFGEGEKEKGEVMQVRSAPEGAA
ncbi:glycosyltransferase family 1 protein [Lentithecium fluviatile CBS 122367]|uniref:Glycosyltransferase family 1 protein n=1 Tax=Lentithecium fluviatile CBS 122367 TaxID=1168545 RepID=A0A6G1J708_9PLEO|nr:glycosyltransferase family 1 protein [Lentithecium fluviatile CBS 122367]